MPRGGIRESDHGDRLLLHGGFNALLWPDVDRMEAAVREWLPTLMQSGGYVFGTSNTIFPGMPLAHYEYMLEVFREFCAERGAARV